jgi:hypothetical protein
MATFSRLIVDTADQKMAAGIKQLFSVAGHTDPEETDASRGGARAAPPVSVPVTPPGCSCGPCRA